MGRAEKPGFFLGYYLGQRGSASQQGSSAVRLNPTSRCSSAVRLNFNLLFRLKTMLLAGVPLIPDLFLEYQQEEIRDKNALVTSGLMVTNEAIRQKFAMGGKTVDLPFYGDLTGDSEIDSDTVASIPADIAGDVQVGVRNMRRKSWKSSDLAADLSGSDPAQAIARRTGRYWIRDMQVTARHIMNGLFGTGGPLSVSHAVGGNSSALSPGLMVDGIAKLGDAGDELTGVMMHSAIYYALMKLDLIVPASNTSQIDARLSTQALEKGTYLGRPVFVDDKLPFTTGAGPSGATVYDTFFFGPGAFAYATAKAKNPVETDRDKFLGIDFLINRTHYLIHPNGVSWKGSAALACPSNAELATPSNWVKVFDDDRNIRITRMRSYIA